MKSSYGFVYLTFGEEYTREAASSAKRVRALHKHAITLITDKEPPATDREAFDDVRVLSLQGGYIDKIAMGRVDYERTIFLDSDTIVQEPMDDLFLVLDRFDIAVQFTEGGNHYTLPTVPACFHEPFAGIIAWKRSDKTEGFFRDWKKAYEQIEAEQGMAGAWDQRSLRLALYQCDLRIFSISAEWQFYTYRPNVVAGPVVMIHGRGLSIEDISGINASSELRVWMPKVGTCPPYHTARLRELFGFIVKLSSRCIKVMLRRFLAATRIWPYPKNKRPA
jgi:hypothetical protein